MSKKQVDNYLDSIINRVDNDLHLINREGRNKMKLAYVRTSSEDQHGKGQFDLLEGRGIERTFTDLGVSGRVAGLNRPGLAELVDFAREGDEIHVAAIDRLGRNTADVLTTVKTLTGKGVKLVSIREGLDFATPVGNLVLTMLAGLAELELASSKERQKAGIQAAKKSGAHLGRPVQFDKAEIARWRKANKASLTQTAAHFRASLYTVKQACRVA